MGPGPRQCRRPRLQRRVRGPVIGVPEGPPRGRPRAPTNTTELAPPPLLRDRPAAGGFYERALGARVTRVLHLPDGSIATAELAMPGLQMALAVPVPGTSLATPLSTGTSVAAYRFAVPDADAAMNRAVSAGAAVHSPVQD